MVRSFSNLKDQREAGRSTCLLRTEGMAPRQIEEKLIAHCKENLPDFKVIRSVHVVDELPRSMLEKVAKNILRERLEPITEGR